MSGQILLTFAGFLLGGCAFLFTMIRWVVGRMDLIRQELLTLRTNDLAHIYAELRAMRTKPG